MGIAEKIAHAKKTVGNGEWGSSCCWHRKRKVIRLSSFLSPSTFQYIPSVPDRRLPASRDHRRQRGSKTVQIPAGRKIQ